MQDGARIHTSTAARAFLAQHYITTVDWPAYLPDFNPIEDIWWHHKRRMHQFHKHSKNYSIVEEQWDDLCKALKKVLQAILEHLIKQLTIPIKNVHSHQILVVRATSLVKWLVGGVIPLMSENL